MEGRSDRQSSPQILGNWDFIPVDPTPIVMVSPPSSPEPVTPVEDDDSTPHSVAMDTRNEPGSAEFAGNSRAERVATSISPPPPSTTGKARVSGKERDGPHAYSQKRLPSAGNVRLSVGKQPAVSYSPSSSAREETRVSEDQPASARNFGISSEKEPNAAAAAACGESMSRRLLPPSLAVSEQWGGGKWKVDWRAKRKKVDEKTDTMFLKEVIEVLIRNSGEAGEEEDDMENFSYVEVLKSMGIRFPE